MVALCFFIAKLAGTDRLLQRPSSWLGSTRPGEPRQEGKALSPPSHRPSCNLKLVLCTLSGAQLRCLRLGARSTADCGEPGQASSTAFGIVAYSRLANSCFSVCFKIRLEDPQDAWQSMAVEAAAEVVAGLVAAATATVTARTARAAATTTRLQQDLPVARSEGGRLHGADDVSPPSSV